MAEMTEAEFDKMMKQFLADRDAALLSMDKETIQFYGDKWGINMRDAPNEETFWASVHMARTGAKGLPLAERIKSKQWLAARGLRALDDGDLPDLSL